MKSQNALFCKAPEKLAAARCYPLGFCLIDINLFEAGIHDCQFQRLIHCVSTQPRSLFYL